jgi:exopolyphosphatase / guanosine-5'-triphosphate,3'-diphosphate pyrophosphatase
MPVIASIDIGTNTVRLLAAEVRDNKIIREVLNLRETTRLGEGLKKGGKLRPEARERTIRALSQFASKMLDAGVKGASAVGTEALRKASDAAEFLEEAREEAGVELRVISAEEEARLTLLGVRSGLGGHALDGQKLIIDIGGGSTEFILTENWSNHKAISLSIGAVNLFERFLLNDPPVSLEMADLTTFCTGQVMAPLKNFLAGAKPLLIGTAGTITTLAAVDLALEVYDPRKVTGYSIDRDRVAVLEGRLAALPKESRRLIAGIEPGREDIILSGTALLGVIMDAAKADKITVCDSGLREGNLLDYYEKNKF